MPATILQADLDASSVLSCFVGGNFKDYQRLGDAANRALGDFDSLVERNSINEAATGPAARTFLTHRQTSRLQSAVTKARKPKPGRQSKARTFVTSAGLGSNDQW